jgi:hypothetical protein
MQRRYGRFTHFIYRYPIPVKTLLAHGSWYHSHCNDFIFQQQSASETIRHDENANQYSYLVIMYLDIPLADG